MAGKPTRILTVRGRPVGFNASRWGGELVAVERGYFPVSPTGYWSCSGFVGKTDVTEQALQDFMEQNEQERDRDRESLLKDLREAVKPVGEPIRNYIHASQSYERAFQDGFFATDAQRASLWAGAYQLLCLVDSDARFQPTADPKYVAWNKEHCDKALAYARDLRGLLIRYAKGDFSEAPPIRVLGAQGYFRLPPKPGGEPIIELGGYVAEMALNLPVEPVRKAERKIAQREKTAPVESATQLGLFSPAPGADEPPPAIRPSL